MEIKKLPITERVTSLETAYAEIGRTFEEMRPYPNPVNEHQEYLNACADEAVFTEALNEGISPLDKAYAYVPVFRRHNHPSGFGFLDVAYGWANSSSYVGSRRSFVDSKVANHAGITFETTYSIIHKHQTK